jgi:two-component system, OmpR family, phosphate regulon sensor histidine kinase PhoR
MAARILVVDDEPGIRSGVGEILALEGYTVDTADCGRAAQELVSGTSYDVMFLDYRLPDVDGLTLFQSIRQKSPRTMTCMITAYANIETAIFATRQGIDIFLPKPFSPDDLISTVDTLLGTKKLRDEAERLRLAHEASLRQLASEQSQTHSLVASLRDGVLVVNRQGEIALANRSMEEILGIDSGKLLRTQVSSALAEGVLAPALAAFSPDSPASVVFEAEAGLKRLFVTVSGFYDETGGLLGRIVTAVDITAVRRMAVEKARFTRTLVHELRAPLTALKSIVEVMRDRSLGNDLDPYMSFLARADERIDGLGELISDLLSLSRIEHEGAVQAPAGPTKIAPAVYEAAELWKDRAAAASVTLEVDLASDLPALAVSAEDLSTILTNLVGNALKYNRPGGNVCIGGVRTSEGLEIAVRDTGIGIDPANLARIGEEFFREKRSETKGIEGNGLGLAIVKRLIDRAAGRLRITSAPGSGSEFRVIFPC